MTNLIPIENIHSLPSISGLMNPVDEQKIINLISTHENGISLRDILRKFRSLRKDVLLKTLEAKIEKKQILVYRQICKGAPKIIFKVK